MIEFLRKLRARAIKALKKQKNPALLVVQRGNDTIVRGVAIIKDVWIISTLS